MKLASVASMTSEMIPTTELDLGKMSSKLASSCQQIEQPT